MKSLSISKILWPTIVLFGVAGFLVQYLGPKSPKSNGSQDLTQVERMDIAQRVTIAGNVIPERKTLIAAPFDGYIKKLYVKVGQKVKPGDPIVAVAHSLQSRDPVFPLRAPFKGTVVQVGKAEGAFVRKASKEDFLVRIDSLDRLYIMSQVPEIEITKIKTGLETIIKVSAILGKTYKGVLQELALASKEKQGWRSSSKVDFTARVEILDPDQLIMPGMSTIMDIITQKKEKVLALPHEYVFSKNNKHFALLEDGRHQQIKVGMQNESHYEIVEGLSEGQKVKAVDFMELLQN